MITFTMTYFAKKSFTLAYAKERFKILLARFKHPVSLPRDIGEALGLHLSNFSNFDDMMGSLISPPCSPELLYRYMPKVLAERQFVKARRKESFGNTSLFSYCFSSGWVEFSLHFDKQSRLRRLYVRHQCIESDQGIELPLRSDL